MSHEGVWSWCVRVVFFPAVVIAVAAFVASAVWSTVSVVVAAPFARRQRTVAGAVRLPGKRKNHERRNHAFGSH